MRRRDTRAALPDLGVHVPPELLDPGHALWHDPTRYRAYLGRLRLPPSERFGVSSSPANRRAFAAMGWAAGNGIERDWPRLRSWGLID